MPSIARNIHGFSTDFLSETEKRRMRALQRRLLPPGTRLKDAPPDWRGLSWQEWEELQRLEWRALAG
jgi:hypothetical protein